MTLTKPKQWPASATLTDKEREIIWDMTIHLPTRRKGVVSEVRSMLRDAQRWTKNKIHELTTENFYLVWACIEYPPVALASNNNNEDKNSATIEADARARKFTNYIISENYSHTTIPPLMDGEKEDKCASSVFIDERNRLMWGVKPRTLPGEDEVRPKVQEFLSNEGRSLLYSSKKGLDERVRQFVTDNWGDPNLEPDLLIMEGVSECECYPIKDRGDCGHIKVSRYALSIGLYPNTRTPITLAMDENNLKLVLLWINDPRDQERKYFLSLLIHLKMACNMRSQEIIAKNGADLYMHFRQKLDEYILRYPSKDVRRKKKKFKQSFIYYYNFAGGNDRMREGGKMKKKRRKRRLQMKRK